MGLFDDDLITKEHPVIEILKNYGVFGCDFDSDRFYTDPEYCLETCYKMISNGVSPDDYEFFKQHSSSMTKFAKNAMNLFNQLSKQLNFHKFAQIHVVVKIVKVPAEISTSDIKSCVDLPHALTPRDSADLYKSFVYLDLILTEM